MQELVLAVAEPIRFIEMQMVFAMTFENHERLVVQDEIWAFIESREHLKRVTQFDRQATRLDIAGRSPLAQLCQPQHLQGQRVADSRDSSDRAAGQVTMHDLRIDSDHQRQA